MKEQQPDKIFRNKLSGFQRQVPEGAWDRIEKELDKKKNPYARLAIAASLLLVCLAGGALWLNKPAGVDTLAENTRKTTTSAPVTKDIPSETDRINGDPDPVKESGADDRTARMDAGKRTDPKKPARDNKAVEGKHEEKKSAGPVDTGTPSPPFAAEKQAEADKSEARKGNTTGLETAVADVVSPSDQRSDESVVIVMSTEETNEYLTKNNTPEATQPNKKTSTLKKVLKKASDLKNNDQDPFGDLRQMKNEILALNFKSEKQRGQNK